MWIQWVQDYGTKALQCAEYNGTLVPLEATGCEVTGPEGLDLNTATEVCVGTKCSKTSDYSDIIPMPKGCVLSYFDGVLPSGAVSVVFAASTMLVMAVNFVALIF